ncbi:hypothetical protein GCM10022252_45510 [Streptosporangium oxazolinicum]|uniref:Uncharacterized protein n=1 Tax=Streptosporangium oxazolinicum TaxID=909287 RepID=A0ABP8B3W9_9ACTN
MLLAIILGPECPRRRLLLFFSLFDDGQGKRAKHQADADQGENDGPSRGVSSGAACGLAPADEKRE